MVQVGNTSGLTIDSCSFLRNTNDSIAYAPDAMFSVSQSENVVVKNSIFAENVAAKLIEQEAQKNTVFGSTNTFENNSFD